MNFSKLKNTDKLAYKKQLKTFCEQLLQAKVAEAMESMERAQEAANGEEKSSMGDKYEITKVMGQIDSDRAGLQLFEGKKQLAQLKQVPVEAIFSEVQAGAFIHCKEINYFIASSIGGKVFEEEKINIISTQAPVALQLMGKKKGDSFTVNGKTILIDLVF